MKKFLFLQFSLLLLLKFATAQTIDISGTVKDDEGQPVHFAFVKDVQSKSAVYTDSLGTFTLNANPNSSLYISGFGFKDTVIKINARTNIKVELKTSVNISVNKVTNNPNEQGISHDAGVNSLSAIMATDGLQEAGGANDPNRPRVDAAQGAIFPVFNPKEETQGSRYLLKGWIHGYVINAKDSLIEDPAYLFEYDKMGGGLLMTRNRVSAIEVDRDMVQSFTLYDEGNVAYTFENVKQINPSHYVQVISSCDKYKIYKDIKTTFEKSNFASDGLYSTGHNYDEYKDEYTYYVYDVKTKALQPLSLKKKAIKVAFAADADKLNKFMSDHSSDSIDDMYLEELCSTLNE